MTTIRELLMSMVDKNASDLFLAAGVPPAYRINGKMVRSSGASLLGAQTQEWGTELLNKSQKEILEREKALTFALTQKDSRYRASLFYQRGNLSGVFRRVPLAIPHFKELGLPSVVGDLTSKKSGLILIVGTNGSGRTTTVASLLDKINQESEGHILTIEDPIEFVHSHKGCIVSQREIGTDISNLTTAMAEISHQNPDCVDLGELTTLEKLNGALQMAESGKLVFATYHAPSVVQALGRLISMFPEDRQSRVRDVLSASLQGVVVQELVMGSESMQVLACEVMIPNPTIRNLIFENKIQQIHSQMQMGQTQTGMMTMNQSLMSLLQRRKVTMKVAFEASPDPEELDAMLKKSGM